MIGDGVATVQFELEPGTAMSASALPGTVEQFESALRPATIARLSLAAPVRAVVVLPYAVDARVDPFVGHTVGEAPIAGRPAEFAIIVGNDPDCPVPYLRVAIKGVSLPRQVPEASDDVMVQLDPGEYFIELRRGSTWAEVEHPVPLNRVSYFAERQAAAARRE